MEAKARGVSKDDLVKQEITSKVPEVTDEDVHSFYQELSKQRRELPPEERLAPQIRSHLQKQKEHAVREVFIDQLKAKAKSIGLDTAQFDQCLDNGKYPDTVKSDVKAGMIAGVSGTPAVFINGRFVNGAQPYEMFTRIIDEELAKAGKTDNG
jgi:protein-disulfide isomerase